MLIPIVNRLTKWIVTLAALASFSVTSAYAGVNVLTAHNDDNRSGANLSESTLTTSNVTVNNFGKLFTQAVDGQIYAQPLYMSGLAIPNKGTHNVVFVATMNDSVYAFDADSNSGGNQTSLWEDHFTNPAANITAIPAAALNPLAPDIIGTVGILSTPVIDANSNTLFVLARTLESGIYLQKLHALDVTTGAEKFNGPVTINATYNGPAGTITFDPQWQNQRVALGLANGNVYITWAGHNDYGNYHGWVMAYSASTLQQVATFVDTAKGNGGGIWEPGTGPVFDPSGNLYYSTGNGDWDGIQNFGSSMIKLSPSLTLTDYFTPDNYSTLNAEDLDLGSSGPLLIPNTSLLVGGGKQGIFYLVDTTSMGHEVTGNSAVRQSFLAANGHIHESPIYYQSPTAGSLVYIWSEFDYLKAFHFDGNLLGTSPLAQSQMRAPDGMPGAFMSISANGTAANSGIVWAAMPFNADGQHAIVKGILRAFDASNVSNELWNTEQNPSRDNFGNMAKFSPPTIANGKVYLATFSNALVVYGLLAPNADFALGSPLSSDSVSAGNNLTYVVQASALPGSQVSEPINLAVAGLPSGVSASFSPATLTASGSTNLTISTPSSIPQGSYTFSVTGSSGSSSHTMNFQLNVTTAAAGFGNASSMDVGAPQQPGSSTLNNGVYTVTGSGTDIAGTADQFQFNYWPMSSSGQITARLVSISNSGLYSKAGVMIRNSLSPNAAYALLESSASIYGFAFRNADSAFAGNSGYFHPQFPLWMRVVRTNNNFTGFVSPDGMNWTQVGEPVSIKMNDPILFGLAVASATGSPVTAQFDNVSYSPVANIAPDFNLTVNPLMTTTLAGNTASILASITGMNGFSAPVTFTLSNSPEGVTSTTQLPSGMIAAINPPSLNGTGITTINLSTQTGITPAPYALMVRAASGAIVRNQLLMLNVGGFTLSADTQSQTVSAGNATAYAISDTDQNGYSGLVTLAVSGLPSGASAAFSPNAVNRITSSELTIATSAATPPGTYALTVSGTSNGQAQTLRLTLVVNALPDFSINVTSGAQTVQAGSTTSFGLSTGAVGNFNGSISLSISGLPAGVTAAFNPGSLAGASSAIANVTTSAAVPPGQYPIVIVGTSGALSHSAQVLLNISGSAPVFGEGAGMDLDIGQPAIAGSASVQGGTYSVGGSGSDIWGAGDQFNFNYWPMTGDGTWTARVTGITNTSLYAKAGLMIRETLSPSSTYAFAETSPAMFGFHYRTATGVYSASSAYFPVQSPEWVRIVRAAGNFSMYSSPDGVNWLQVGNTVSITMANSVYVGLAVSAVNNGVLNTATFDNLSYTGPVAPAADFLVTSATPSAAIAPGQSATYPILITPTNSFANPVTLSVAGLPPGSTAVFSPATLSTGTTTLTITTSPYTPLAWAPVTVVATAGTLTRTSAVSLFVGTAAPVFGEGAGMDLDIGQPAIAGSASVQGGTYSVGGSGSDIWGAGDQFNFNYWPMTGDGTWTARVTGITNTSLYAKAGLMIRETLSPSSTYAFAETSPAMFGFHYRTATGVYSASSAYFPVQSPEWVRIVRAAGNFSMYSSPDGVNWLQVGNTVSITMANSVYVGLAVSAVNNGVLNTATFDNLSYTGPVAPAADFLVTSATPSAAIAPGQSATYPILITPTNSFANPVTLSVAGLPPGSTAVFSPATLSTGTTTLTITTSPYTPLAWAPVTVVATAGTLTRTSAVSLFVGQ